MPRLGRALKKLMGDDALVFKATVEHSAASIFMHPNRRIIFSALCQVPFSNHREMARKTQLSPPTIKWHLDLLAESAHVAFLQQGRSRFYYPASLLEEEEIDPMFHAARHESLFKSIAGASGITQKELAARLSITQQGTSKALVAMQRAGIVECEGRPKQYRTTPLLANIKENIKERGKSCRASIMLQMQEHGFRPKVKSRSSHGVVLELNIGGRREEWKLSFMPRVLKGKV
jgi:DNA-binding transcriptional ArsR family regulator